MNIKTGYYFDEKYGCVKIPSKYKGREKELSFDGVKLYIDKSKSTKQKLNCIFSRLDELQILRVKNQFRYGHHNEEFLIRDKEYLNEIIDLEKQIEKIKGS